MVPSCQSKRVHRGVGSSRMTPLGWPRKARWVQEWIGETRHQLDEIGLPSGAGLSEQAVKMGFDRRLGKAQRLRGLRHPANLDDGEQHARLARRQFVEPGDGILCKRAFQSRLVDEYCGDRSVSCACAAKSARCERQHASDVVSSIACAERYYGSAAAAGRAVASHRKAFLQRPGCIGLAGDQRSGHRAQYRSLLQERMTAQVGMNDATCCVDQEQSRPQPVQRFHQHRGCGRFECTSARTFTPG
jgi:hypothetical protein